MLRRHDNINRSPQRTIAGYFQNKISSTFMILTLVSHFKFFWDNYITFYHMYPCHGATQTDNNNNNNNNNKIMIMIALILLYFYITTCIHALVLLRLSSVSWWPMLPHSTRMCPRYYLKIFKRNIIIGILITIPHSTRMCLGYYLKHLKQTLLFAS